MVKAVESLLDYQLDKTKVEQIINAFKNAGAGSVLYNDPRFLGTLTKFWEGHFDHIHFSIPSPFSAGANRPNLQVPLNNLAIQDFSIDAISSDIIGDITTNLSDTILFASGLLSLENAIDLGTFEGDKNLIGVIDSTNPEQYYKFVLGNPVSTEDNEEAYFTTFRAFSLLLNGLSNDLDVELIADFNQDGIRQNEEVIDSSEQISR